MLTWGILKIAIENDAVASFEMQNQALKSKLIGLDLQKKGKKKKTTASINRQTVFLSLSFFLFISHWKREKEE